MSIFVLQANPVGVPTNLLDEKVMSLKALWDQENAARKANSKWWKIWSKTKEGLTASISFLINCLDVLVTHVDQFKDIEGKDKKATVLLAAALLYDYVVANTLPIWLKPFSSKIKDMVIYVALSYAIDFIVEKYRSGTWKGDQNDSETPTESQTNT